MASTIAQGMIDPTKPARYPVILSDELLGKHSTEQYTAIKYNHKPALSSDYAPTQATLKPSTAAPGRYNLGFKDGGDKYAYNGTRDADESQYALIFDSAREAFVLHRIESTFNMNLARTPSNSNPESLQAEYPHIGLRKSVEQTSGRDRASKPEEKTRKPAKEKAAPAALTFPTASSPRVDPVPSPGFSSKRRRSTPSEDEDDDGDGGLLIEYPGAEPPSSARQRADFSPAFSPQPPQVMRRYSEFQKTNDDDIMQYEDDDDEDQGAEVDADADADADAESDDAPADDDEDRLAAFKLPSPVGRSGASAQQPVAIEDDEADADMDDIEADFEAEMENAFKEVKSGAGEESDVSEED